MKTWFKICFSLIISLYTQWCFGQKPVEGIVFDVDTKQRVGRVQLINQRDGASIYNNNRGEFKLIMQPGDHIIAIKDNYYSDTLIYDGSPVIIFKLKKEFIYIDPITIIGKRSPSDILASRKEEFNKAYRLADPGDYLTVGPTGAGLSIDAVYNYFSREGKNARRLTRLIQEEYEDNIVDMYFSKELVNKTLGIEGQILDNFMVRYRPSYEFVVASNPIQMVKYIKSKYEFFKHAPDIKPLIDLNSLTNQKND